MTDNALNKTIEGAPSAWSLWMDDLISDLETVEHEAEIDSELRHVLNSVEMQQAAETELFFNDAFSVEDHFNDSLSSVDESEFDGFEFTVGRFLILPILVKTMMQSRNRGTWLINTEVFSQHLDSIAFSSVENIEALYSASWVWWSWHITKLFSLLKSDSVFMKEWISKRLQSQVVNPLKNAAVTYADQYNTLKQGKLPKKDGWVKKLYKDVFVDWEDLGTALKQADGPTQSILRGLSVWALTAGAYMLFKKTPQREWWKSKVKGFFWDVLRSSIPFAAWWWIARVIAKQFEKQEMSFEDSLKAVQSEVDNVISESDIKRGMGTITYDPTTSSLKSYKRYATPISIETKEITGLDISFTSHKNVIHAANLLNYVKYAYRGCWIGPKPFFQSKTTGDIYINRRTWDQEIISWGWWSTLSSICPDINSATWRQIICAYLNGQTDVHWNQWDQDRYENPKNDVEVAINATMDVIEPRNPDDQFGNIRELTYEQVGPQYKGNYIIKSRDQETLMTIKNPDGPLEDQSIVIDGLWETLTITAKNGQYYTHTSRESMVREAVMLVNLSHKAVKTYRQKCKTVAPFEYGHWLQLKSIYVDTKDSMLDTEFLEDTWDNRAIFPTLFASLDANSQQSNPYIHYLNTMEENGMSIWLG